MLLRDYCIPEGVHFIESRTKQGAFEELSKKFAEVYGNIDADELLKRILERESVLSTWIASGIAIPHAIVPGFGPSRILLGISKEGIPYGAPDERPVHLLILIVGDGIEHLQVLRQVAIRLETPQVYEQIVFAHHPIEAYRAFVGKGGAELSQQEKELPMDREGRFFLSQACWDQGLILAERIEASHIFVHADCLEELDFFPKDLPRKICFVAVSRVERIREQFPDHPVVQIPFKGVTRANQVELSIIFALSRGLLRQEERVVSIFGVPFSGILDSVRVTDIGREFKVFFAFGKDKEGQDLENQVLMRVIEIAGELAEEGREGKPSGTIFVLGDYEQVQHHCQQMIINPFAGYPESDRNILDPSLKETIKELSKLDGAFVIRGNGVIVSAGTYLRSRVPPAELPSGLGARHTAAAAITVVSRAVAVVLSESTRRVSIFKSGERIMVL
ncbi:MAG: PTS sugar transporter subunit IIA [Spirochaetes bacterium]|nr:PTS sugar transporter subunit IIA [Spirochaetota bacterium]